ncbi:MAG: MlaD family protein [Calditrichia bacterium]
MAFNSNEIKSRCGGRCQHCDTRAVFGCYFRRFRRKETNEYRVNLDYVGGITKGSLVKYRGLNVGRVKLCCLAMSNRSSELPWM